MAEEAGVVVPRLLSAVVAAVEVVLLRLQKEDRYQNVL